VVKFCNWDERPVVFSDFEAKALLKPGSTDWVEADFSDVINSCRLMPEVDWRRRFKYFGSGLDNLPSLMTVAQAREVAKDKA
jgi:hypothetical protein